MNTEIKYYNKIKNYIDKNYIKLFYDHTLIDNEGYYWITELVYLNVKNNRVVKSVVDEMLGEFGALDTQDINEALERFKEVLEFNNLAPIAEEF